jgi:O-antigen/teichoic acid export membrane protein
VSAGPPSEPSAGGGAGVRSQLPPGVLDAGFASLATFVAGLAAVAVFDDADLGIYAVFFVAFTLGQLVAYQLIYVPAEIVAVGRTGVQRLTIFNDSLRIGFWPAIVGASAIFAATITTAPIASMELTIGLTVTAWIATFLSPTQDHVRRTLHVADHSWQAAAMSTTQFVVSSAAIALMLIFDAPAPWVPFGALAIANVVSLSVGLLLVRRDRQHAETPIHVTFRDLTADGRWLLLQASIPAAAAFVTANIITYLAGPEAMGYAEAARIVAQPVLVLAGGLIYPLRPRAMEAALKKDLPVSIRLETIYISMILVGGVGYLLLAGAPFPWNPMQYLVPVAYEVPGLVAASIGANVVLGSIFLAVNEMMAAGRGRSLAFLNALAAPIRIVVATSAAFVGAFARPLSEAIGEVVIISGLLVYHRQIYSAAQPEPASQPETAAG